MKYIDNLKKNAKSLPKLLWIGGLIVPGGLTLIAAYIAYKSSKDNKEEKTLEETLNEVRKEVENDRG